jgi:acid stress chaperone HdeB
MCLRTFASNITSIRCRNEIDSYQLIDWNAAVAHSGTRAAADLKVIHLSEITCKTFVEEMKGKQGIIVAWLQGYYLPEHEPPVIDVDKLLSDSAKLTEHCINKPEDDLMTAAEAIFGK